VPNTNPSGANQPLNQHPLPSYQRYVLSRDAQFVKGLTESPANGSVNAVVVPAPSDSRVRREILPGSIGITVEAGSADVTGALLMHIDSSGKRALLATLAGGPFSAGESAIFFPFGAGPLDFPFHLLQGDGGIAVAVLSAGAASVSVYAQWQDVRNVERVNVTLQENVPATLFTAPEGNARILAPSSAIVPPGQGIVGFNWDDTIADVIFELYDGSDSVQVGSVALGATLTPGIGGLSTVGAPVLPSITIPAGWELRATMTSTPNNTGPVELYASASLTNLGEAREDQGGAY
jgi:hypothetical protein